MCSHYRGLNSNDQLDRKEIQVTLHISYNERKNRKDAIIHKSQGPVVMCYLKADAANMQITMAATSQHSRPQASPFFGCFTFSANHFTYNFLVWCNNESNIIALNCYHNENRCRNGHCETPLFPSRLKGKKNVTQYAARSFHSGNNNFWRKILFWFRNVSSFLFHGVMADDTRDVRNGKFTHMTSRQCRA